MVSKKNKGTKINIDQEWEDKDKLAKKPIIIHDLPPIWNQNEDADIRIDEILKEKSEENYLRIVANIVEVSQSQLTNQNTSKQENRKILLSFFKWFLLAQYVVMLALFVLKGFTVGGFSISDSIILTYITSVFVETVGAIIIMVKYAFKSDQEVQILKILNGVVEKFQKFSK